MESYQKTSLKQRLEHNANVERARIAHHLRRCSENPIYKRMYERMCDFQKRMQETTVKNLLSLAENTDNVSQNKKSNPQQTSSIQEGGNVTHIDSALYYAIAATIFSKSDILKELNEEMIYLKEYMEAEHYYDTQKANISGWEI